MTSTSAVVSSLNSTSFVWGMNLRIPLWWMIRQSDACGVCAEEGVWREGDEGSKWRSETWTAGTETHASSSRAISVADDLAPTTRTLQPLQSFTQQTSQRDSSNQLTKQCTLTSELFSDIVIFGMNLGTKIFIYVFNVCRVINVIIMTITNDNEVERLFIVSTGF